jgi:hypothetical protein
MGDNFVEMSALKVGEEWVVFPVAVSSDGKFECHHQKHDACHCDGAGGCGGKGACQGGCRHTDDDTPADHGVFK